MGSLGLALQFAILFSPCVRHQANTDLILGIKKPGRNVSSLEFRVISTSQGFLCTLAVVLFALSREIEKQTLLVRWYEEISLARVPTQLQRTQSPQQGLIRRYLCSHQQVTEAPLSCTAALVGFMFPFKISKHPLGSLEIYPGGLESWAQPHTAYSRSSDANLFVNLLCLGKFEASE